MVGEKQLRESVSFEELSPMKEGVFAFGAALVGDSIFVIGGDMSVKNAAESKYRYEHISDKMQVYDIRRDEWSISGMRLSDRAYHNAHYYDGKLFIIGGKRFSTNKKIELLNDNVEVYHIKDDTVYLSRSNPHQAVNFASGLYQGNIVVMNGSVKRYRDKQKITEQAHLFDLHTGYWYQLDK